MWRNWMLIILVLGGGCTAMHLEGDCTITRKFEMTAQCEPGGKIEAIRTYIPE